MIRFLYGENDYAVDAAVRTARQAYLAEYDSFGLEVLDGEEVGYALVDAALNQLPFLVSKKLVIVRHIFAHKELVEKLQGSLENVPDEIDVLLVDAKPDKRTKLYKYLDKTCPKEVFNPLDMPQLIKWVKDTAVSQNVVLSDALARSLVERSGADQYRLFHDIEVLALQPQPITPSMLQELVQPTLSSTIFELLEAAFAHKLERALQIYNELLTQKVDPHEIVPMIGWQLHIYALIKSAGDRPAAEIARLGKVHPFVVSKSTSIARAMTLVQLKKLVEATLNADLALKTSRGNPHDVGRVLILELSQG